MSRHARLLSILVALGATMLGGGTAAAAGHVVRITSTLEPATIRIAPGDRVTWRNDDGDRHRIRSTGGPGDAEFDSGNLEPGESFRVRLNRPGRYEYYDHRNDEQSAYYGTIIVEDRAAGDPGDPNPDGPGGLGGADPTSATIAIGDRVFRPRDVTIAAGGSVTWRNGDDREHTATESGGGFDTGVLSPGESARETFPNPGTFSYLCVIHPEMSGTVTVTRSGGAPAPEATPKPRPAEPTTNPDVPSEEAAASRVVIRDFEFAPTEVTVDTGTRVTFANRGAAPHTVTAEDGSFDSGLIGAGGSWDRTFDTPGTFAYACSFHPQMAATIRVRPAGSAGAEPSPPAASTEPPSPASSSPRSTSPPGSEAPASDSGTGPGGAGADTSGPVGADASAASREIGTVLVGLAVGGGMLLVIGAGAAAVRPSRGTASRGGEAPTRG